MSYNQAKNVRFDHFTKEHLTRFLYHLGEAELALQEYLADQSHSTDTTSTPIPGTDYLSVLRERAEKARFDASIVLEVLSQTEIKHLFHELQVHQIELWMQNDELRRVPLEQEASHDQFSRLYDPALVGDCTIDPRGMIPEANWRCVNYPVCAAQSDPRSHTAFY